MSAGGGRALEIGVQHHANSPHPPHTFRPQSAEPNCGFYAVGGCCGAGCGNQTAYFELYATTAGAVKAVDALLPVGGPSTAQLAWLPEFLAFVKTSGAPLDFVSSHLYPTDPSGTVTNHTRDGFMASIAIAAATAATAGVPFLLTEFNGGLTPPAFGTGFLDTAYAGAFLIHAHLGAQAVANLVSMSYWTFTDWGFEENGVDPAPWHNKFGIMSAAGVRKPVYHAFTWLAALPPSAIPVKPLDAASPTVFQLLNAEGQVVGATSGCVDVTAAVSTPQPGLPTTVTAIATNFNHSDYPAPADVTIMLNFVGIPAGAVVDAAAVYEVVDATHANPAATWIANGSPPWPNATEVAMETAAATVVPTSVALTRQGDGSLSATFTLSSWAFARLTFNYE